VDTVRVSFGWIAFGLGIGVGARGQGAHGIGFVEFPLAAGLDPGFSEAVVGVLVEIPVVGLELVHGYQR
jgi:hypothetical protein